MISNSYTQKPLSNGAPKQIVVFLHGYGSNGQDLISLAPYFANALPDAVFVSPDAPYPCEVGMGYQWFSLAEYTPVKLLEGAQQAHPVLDNYLDKLLKEYELTADKMALVGFSQGTMMSLYTGLRQNPALGGVLGYSGALVGLEAVDNENRAPICLIHGENDSVVPVVAYQDACQKLLEKGYDVSGHSTPNLEHSIDEAGIQVGASFLGNIFN